MAVKESARLFVSFCAAEPVMIHVDSHVLVLAIIHVRELVHIHALAHVIIHATI